LKTEIFYHGFDSAVRNQRILLGHGTTADDTSLALLKWHFDTLFAEGVPTASHDHRGCKQINANWALQFLRKLLLLPDALLENLLLHLDFFRNHPNFGVILHLFSLYFQFCCLWLQSLLLDILVDLVLVTVSILVDFYRWQFVLRLFNLLGMVSKRVCRLILILIVFLAQSLPLGFWKIEGWGLGVIMQLVRAIWLTKFLVIGPVELWMIFGAVVDRLALATLHVRFPSTQITIAFR